MANLNATLMGLLLKGLRQGGTIYELCDITGFSESTLRRYTRTWYKQGIVYIADYRRRKNHLVKVWRLRADYEEDAKKPRLLTGAEISWRSKQKLRGKMDADQLLADLLQRTIYAE